MIAPVPSVLGSMQGIAMLFRRLHENGQDDLAWALGIGGLVGGACSVPALIVADKKNLSIGGIFWFNAIAGALGGLYFAIPSGIVSLIYATVRIDPRKHSAEKESNGTRLATILTLVASVVVCLLVLPHVCTTSVKNYLPDDRAWWQKLRGDPLPTSTLEVTNWGTVIILTLVVCAVTFVIASIVDDGSRKKSTAPGINREKRQ